MCSIHWGEQFPDAKPNCGEPSELSTGFIADIHCIRNLLQQIREPSNRAFFFPPSWICHPVMRKYVSARLFLGRWQAWNLQRMMKGEDDASLLPECTFNAFVLQHSFASADMSRGCFWSILVHEAFLSLGQLLFPSICEVHPESCMSSWSQAVEKYLWFHIGKLMKNVNANEKIGCHNPSAFNFLIQTWLPWFHRTTRDDDFIL